MRTVNGEHKYRFNFPFDPCNSTTVPDNGRRPIYGRRCRFTHVKRGVSMNDCWVASYNAYLLLKYRAHINVEVCTGSSPVKYLIKYILKGADMSIVRTVDENDEVSRYENSVYIGPIDSCWRLWSFDTTDQSPSVYRLNYHEPNKQPFSWPKDISNAEFLHELQHATSELMAWLDYNRLHPTGWQRRLLFVEFPEHFTFDKKLKSWHPREKGKTIGRMYVSYPGQGDRYYIRLLLCHQRGCSSWEDLRTVNGIVCESWQQAAEMMGLLNDGNHWVEMFLEVSPLRPGWVLRQLFVLAMLQNVPRLDRLWHRFARTVGAESKTWRSGKGQDNAADRVNKRNARDV